MRLFPRLLLGHLAPVITVGAALALTLAALVEITSVLQTLNDTDLRTLREESTLHRRCWTLDVALRHADAACSNGEDAIDSLTQAKQASIALRSTLSRAHSGGLRTIALEWLGITDAVFGGDPCHVLVNAHVRTQRQNLDEGLQQFWSSRVEELRSGVEEKERAAQGIGDTALTTGLLLALFALGLALWLARALAGNVTWPLRSLASLTRRVGLGDFGSPIEVAGPLEIRELSEDLERMRLRLAELDAVKQEFLASVSHELRTPLSKLRQALALLQDGVVGELNDEQLRVVGIASKACEREIRMVTTLLDLSRLRAGNPVQLRSGCSIPNIVRAAVDDERDEAMARGVEVTVTLPETMKPYRADPVLLERAVANLVRNAVSVSGPGQTVAVVGFEADHEHGTRWVISVSDQGPGVPADIRQSIFDPFVTLAVPRSPKALGVGLGLALSREIAVAHGGNLELDDSVSVGATFNLWLPVIAPSANDGSSQAPPAPERREVA